MKHFTKNLLLAASALSLSLSVAAETTWVGDNTTFVGTHRTTPVMADFNNDGHMDIYYGGQLDATLTGWEWQIQTWMYLNGGNGESWTVDGYQLIPRTEMRPVLDENGEPVLDENGEPTMEEVAYNERIWPNHGLPGCTYSCYQVLDYNNDGLVDIIINARNNEWDVFDNGGFGWFTYLYKNLGNGQFEIVADAVFPTFNHDGGDATRNFPIAVGDYDRDGYTDLLFSVCMEEKEQENYPGRAVLLYRNEGGTGVFTVQHIAETKGGVWTTEVTDDGGNVITPKEELKNYFLPVSGNVHFADLNNDGWLDIVVNGWTDEMWDGIHAGGNNARVYISQNGEKFVDVTSDLPTFYTLRSSSSNVADVNRDGNLDWFMTGWGDNGVNWNAYLFYGTGNSEDGLAFEDPYDCNTLGLKGTENVKTYIRDFDNDGYADIYYSNNSEGSVYFGNATETYTIQEGDGMIVSHMACPGDVNNDGLPDIFVAGYGWDLTLWNEQNADWGNWDGYCGLNINTLEEKPEAPEVPTNVACEYVDGKLNISWEYDVDTAIETALAYNIFVKKADGSVYTMIPANIETGYIKVGDNRTTAIRPNVTSYSLTLPEGDYTVGVQAISTYNETYSAFATASTGEAGIDNVAADSNAEVVATEYYNIQGQKLNTVPETGIFVKKNIKADGSVKAVKVVK